MRYRQLPLCCACGLSPTAVRHVGLTAEHQLVVRWRCVRCKMEVYVLKDLADCWNECPKPEITVEAPIEGSALSDEMIRRADEAFLNSLGVRMT